VSGGVERNGLVGCFWAGFGWFLGGFGRAIAAARRRLLPLFVKVLRAPFSGPGQSAKLA